MHKNLLKPVQEKKKKNPELITYVDLIHLVYINMYCDICYTEIDQCRVTFRFEIKLVVSERVAAAVCRLTIGYQAKPGTKALIYCLIVLATGTHPSHKWSLAGD